MPPEAKQEREAEMFQWVAGFFMVALILFGVLELVGVVRI